jgi:segregation and condensation protein A
MPYRVKLEIFEGPLDLLLFLIRKNEVEISDIPIAKITQQYLEYVEIIQVLDIESASDFILMAAMLMRIKAQMLLPRPLQDEEEVEDPRKELVQRLLEYKRYKESAANLSEFELQERRYFQRGSFKFEINGFNEEFSTSSEVGLFDLVAAFKQVLDRTSEVPVHRVEELDVSLEDRLQFLQNFFKHRQRVSLFEVFQTNADRIVLIVTFIAVLELIRKRFLRVSQSAPFEDIILTKV